MWEDERQQSITGGSKATLVPPDYATGGYTSGPPAEQMEPETLEQDEPASKPMDFDVDVTLDIPTSDIEAYNKAAAIGRMVFMTRRGEHGSHLDNPPSYDLAALHVKMWRILKRLMAGERPGDDDLIDCSNYCLMVVSRQHRNTAG